MSHLQLSVYNTSNDHIPTSGSIGRAFALHAGDQGLISIRDRPNSIKQVDSSSAKPLATSVSVSTNICGRPETHKLWQAKENPHC